MKRKNVFYVLIFFIGFALGLFITFLIVERQVSKEVTFLQEVYFAKNFFKSDRVYLTQKPEFAVWFLEDLLKEVNTNSSYTGLSPMTFDWNLFEAHARLAKMYQDMGKTELAEQHFREAIDYYHRLLICRYNGVIPQTEPPVTNNVEVLKVLGIADKKLKNASKDE